MLDASIGMTADQALELHDAYWYAQCAMEGKRRGAWVRGEVAKVRNRAEGIRLALVSLASAGATVDASRFPCATDEDCDASGFELMTEASAYGYHRGIDATIGAPIARRCPCCGRPNETWNEKCALCPE
jgi:hypothetical protein